MLVFYESTFHAINFYTVLHNLSVVGIYIKRLGGARDEVSNPALSAPQILGVRLCLGECVCSNPH